MLRFKADRRTLCFIALFYGLVAWQWFYAPKSWPLAALLVAVTCTVAWINAVIAHNTLHAPMFHSRTMNRIAQVAISCAYGYPVSEYIPGHNMSHHKFTQTRRDVMRTTKVNYRWNLLNVLLFFVHVGAGVTAANMKYARTMRKTKPAWFQQFLIEATFTWGSKIVLLAIDWRKALLYVILPHLGAVWGITTVNILQHDGCDTDHEYNHSRNFVGRIFNWFTFNNGFHGIHHMEPGLHWSLLREAHETRMKPFMDSRLDEPSLFLYLVRTYGYPGKRMRYDGTPYIPEPVGEDEDWITPTAQLPDAAGALT